MYFSRRRLAVLCCLALLLAAAGACSRAARIRWGTSVEKEFELGKRAFDEKRYDDSVAHFDKALAITPREPVLLINKSIALRMRAVERYNAAVRAGTGTNSPEREAARQDIRDSASAATQAAQAFESIPARSWPGDPAHYEQSRLLIFAARAESMRLLASVADPTQADAALAASEQYIAIEPNAEKRLKARLGAAQIFLDARQSDKAVREYKKILNDHPDNQDALLGAGLALF